jgi:hypothetical protein
MVLHFPGIIEAETIGEFDLLKGILKELMFAVFVPGTRKLMLVENSELHGFPQLLAPARASV